MKPSKAAVHGGKCWGSCRPMVACEPQLNGEPESPEDLQGYMRHPARLIAPNTTHYRAHVSLPKT